MALITHLEEVTAWGWLGVPESLVARCLARRSVHNMIASILILVSGVFFGIIPILSIGANGFFLGVLYRQVAEVAGYSKAALMVLPHGVFEIPALLLAASYGLWLGVMVVRRMRGKENIPIRSHMEHAFRRYFVVVFPLLIVAAGIETVLIQKLG